MLALAALISISTQAQAQPKIGPRRCTPEIQKLLTAALAQKDPKVKIASLQSIFERAKATGDLTGQGVSLLDKGRAKWARYDKSCLEDYAAAAKLFLQTDDTFEQAIVFGETGDIYFNIGDKRTALARYEAALPLWHKCADDQAEAATLVDAGQASSDLGDKKTALARFEAALPVLRRCGDAHGEATALNNIGSVYDEAGDTKTARDKYEEALRVSQNANDLDGEESALNNIGSSYANQGNQKAALEKYGEVLALVRKNGDIRGEAVMLVNIGGIYSSTGDKKTALEKYEAAQTAFHKCGDISGEAATLVNAGQVHSQLGEAKAALVQFNEALPLLRRSGEIQFEAVTLNNIGLVDNNLGEEKDALAEYEAALKLWQKCGVISGQATTLSNIGAVYDDLGDRRAALEKYEAALAIQRRVGNIASQAATLNNIGLVDSELGDEKSALEEFNEALPLRRRCGDISGQGSTLTNIGVSYSHLGDEKAALAKFKEALPLQQKCGDILREAVIVNCVGLSDFQLGDDKSALENFERALSLRRKCGDVSGQAASLNNIGLVNAKAGNKPAALARFGEALVLQRRSGFISGQAVTLYNIGRAHADLGDLNSAKSEFDLALSLARRCGDVMGEVRILDSISRTLQDPHNPAPSIVFSKIAVNLDQQMREKSPESFLGPFTKNLSHHYVALSEDLAKQERFAESLKVTEMLKGNELYLYTRQGAADPNFLSERVPLTKKEKAWITGYRTIADGIGELGAEQEKLRRLGPKNRDPQQEKRFTALTALLKTKESQFQSYLKTIVTTFPKATKPEGLESDTSLNSDLLELKQSTGQTAVALIYALADKTGSVVLAAPGYALKGAPIPDSRAAINKRALALWQKLQDPTTDPIPAASELYDLLIRPVEKDFPKDTKVLMLNLQGGLEYIPFGALYDRETSQWLADKYETVVFTTKSRSRWNLEPKSGGAVAAFGVSKAEVARDLNGNPRSFGPLPGVPAELAAAAPHPILDESFDRMAWESVLRDRGRSVIHLATHCLLGSDNSSTYILLGDGTLFSLGELKSEQSAISFAGVDLLVLSACQTAVGDGDGAELEGFAAVCEQEGARAVLASQWRVDDTATQRQMKRFYSLRRDNKSWTKLQCLEQASRDLREGRLGAKGDSNGRGDPLNATSGVSKWTKAAWSHPYYWAPFVLFGNWK